MDPLTLQLLQRQMGGAQAPPEPTPTVLPSIPSKVPSQEKRWQNAQAMQDAYRGDWTPNPILLRASLGHK